MATGNPPAGRQHRTRYGPVPIEPELLDQLRAAAARHGRSLNGEFRYAIRIYVEMVQRREGAGQPRNGTV